MKAISYALQLEKDVLNQLTIIKNTSSQELIMLIDLLEKFQYDLIEVLAGAENINEENEGYPIVDSKKLLWTEAQYKELLNNFVQVESKSNNTLLILWMVYALIEKSAQFYQQAAINSAHPSVKLFFNSISEIKGMLRRRVDGVMRNMYNEVWEKLGFAIFTMNKD